MTRLLALIQRITYGLPDVRIRGVACGRRCESGHRCVLPAGHSYDHESRRCMFGRDRVELVRHGWFVALALACSMVTSACAGAWESHARVTLHATDTALHEVDSRVSRAYTQASREHLERAQSRDEYERLMVRWDAAELSLRTAHDALIVGQAAVDAGSRETWRDALPCIAAAVAGVVVALDGAGVEVPGRLRDAGRALRGVAFWGCASSAGSRGEK